mmetsp:Transcript_33314/g.53387  ORF Transcript_33314/g.53387 Transcript_33314/m.53387 type:complete len:251 (-) Transcript_33314:1219-1971(-)
MPHRIRTFLHHIHLLQPTHINLAERPRKQPLTELLLHLGNRRHFNMKHLRSAHQLHIVADFLHFRLRQCLLLCVGHNVPNHLQQIECDDALVHIHNRIVDHLIRETDAFQCNLNRLVAFRLNPRDLVSLLLIAVASSATNAAQSTSYLLTACLLNARLSRSDLEVQLEFAAQLNVLGITRIFVDIPPKRLSQRRQIDNLPMNTLHLRHFRRQTLRHRIQTHGRCQLFHRLDLRFLLCRSRRQSRRTRFFA